MAFWIVLGVTFAAAAVAMAVSAQNLGSGWPRRIVGGIAITWIAWLVVFLAMGDETYRERDHRAELLTLRDGAETETHGSGGGVFLAVIGVGGGSVDSAVEWRYTWYERGETGATYLRSEKATTNRIAVYEDVEPGDVPYVRWVETSEPALVPSWVAPFDGWTYKADWEPDRTELHVPPGTVERDLQLDAE